jgi:CRISPR-associated protein Cas1
MIKRTLYFGNPARLSIKDKQLNIKLLADDNEKNVPIEDIGVVVLDHYQISITQKVFESLLNNNAAIITCNSSHLPHGLLLNLDGNTIQTERFREQINVSEPLKKRLWQQTIVSKIENQAKLLEKRDIKTDNMFYWAKSVKSGDSENHEARAAAYYWDKIFPNLDYFYRGRYEDPPNNLLNYGYAILRAVVARALVSSGLLPSLGIHHRNKYNAYCLADDIMEPYRPFVDKLVCDIVDNRDKYGDFELTKEIKAILLNIPVLDIKINGRKSPLMVGVSQTTASLYKCFEGSLRKIIYPEMV